MVQAIVTPQIALLHTSYFTLRSGGRTVITFLFDSVFMWVVSVPVAFILSRFTSIYVIWIFFFVNMADLLKGILGVILVKKGVWMKNIVNDNKELQEEYK
jgi:Na+-driven multidrug efflux pump